MIIFSDIIVLNLEFYLALPSQDFKWEQTKLTKYSKNYKINKVKFFPWKNFFKSVTSHFCSLKGRFALLKPYKMGVKKRDKAL